MFGVEVTKRQDQQDTPAANEELLHSFLAAKHIEGCSDKSLKYYNSVIENMLGDVDKPIVHIVTDDLRQYLDRYQKQNNASKITVDNVRRILSTFLRGWKMRIISLKALFVAFTR